MLRAAAAPARVGRPFLARGPREDRIRGLLADGGAVAATGARSVACADSRADPNTETCAHSNSYARADARADAASDHGHSDAASDHGHSVAAAKRATDDLERSVLGAEREPVARTEQRAVRI